KGSSVLRMLEGFLGQDAFRAGLRTYMAAFGGGNAVGADLWKHLGAASERDVERIMQSWIAQPGHPMLSVALQGQELHLRQQRFRSMPGAAPGEQVWEVPLVVRYHDEAGTHELRYLLREREARAPLSVQGKLAWLHANAGDVGFYRADPDVALLAGLRAHAAELSPAERVGLLRDQWALARAGARPPDGCFGLLGDIVPREPHYAVIETGAEIAREAERLLEVHTNASALQRYRAWVGRAFAPILEAAGPDARPSEKPAEGLRRAAAYRAVAGVARDPKALEQALRIAARERADPAAVDANLASTVVNLAAQAGDGARFDEHVKAYVARRDSKRSPQEADRYLLSFVHFRPPELVARTLALLQDGTVPKQSVGPLLTVLLREPHAQHAAFEHVVERWEPLRKELGDPWAANLAEAMGWLPPSLKAHAEAFLQAQAGDFVQSRGRGLDLLAERAAVFEGFVPALAAWARSA
ncbi:MAG TPA: ERAP1-like C-terminal domain-containing protein, partial [Candidatus Thermoplasmatota archaeon]|nr:ERAP1-like C-terminal domain-containing protein [Candidatus Thermoplasmatota archaeon]